MKLNGIIGYPVTPFSDDNTINLPVLKQMLNLLIENGCDAIAPLGSTGESAYLEWDEWCLVAKLQLKALISACLSLLEFQNSPLIKPSKAQIAQSYGADALMVIPVSYWKLTDQEILNIIKRLLRPRVYRLWCITTLQPVALICLQS